MNKINNTNNLIDKIYKLSLDILFQSILLVIYFGVFDSVEKYKYFDLGWYLLNILLPIFLFAGLLQIITDIINLIKSLNKLKKLCLHIKE